MSDIHINRAGQNLGIFTQTEVQSGLDTGRFIGSDLAWSAGMENWKPLSQWADLTVPAVAPAIPGIPPLGTFTRVTPDLQDQPSWEQRQQIGFFAAFGATVKEVLIEPAATFSRMKETGGFFNPFLYMLLTTGLGTFLALAVQFSMQGMMASTMASQNNQAAHLLATYGIGMTGAILGFLITFPIALFVGSFIGSGLWHLALMVLGGANKPFEATYRVFCYTKGSTSLVSLVPCCGPFVSIIWNIVAGSIGLAKVHGIGTGKAVLAILLPFLLCCSVCGVGMFFGFQALSSNPDFINALNQLKHH